MWKTREPEQTCRVSSRAAAFLAATASLASYGDVTRCVEGGIYWKNEQLDRSAAPVADRISLPDAASSPPAKSPRCRGQKTTTTLTES
jgi:hypothetical protein